MKLPPDFERKLRTAALDALEAHVREEVAPTLESGVRDRLEAYGDRHDYDVSTLVEAMRVRVRRGDRHVGVVVELPSPARLFETGTSDHAIRPRNADVLSFVWERRHDPPQWVRQEFEAEGDGWRVFLPEVEVSGLPEGRFVRDTLHQLRRQLS